MVWSSLPYVFLEAKEYYERSEDSAVGSVTARQQLKDLHRAFRSRVLDVFAAANEKRDESELTSDSSEESEEDEKKPDVGTAKGAQKERPIPRPEVPRRSDPNALNGDILFNEKNRLNDGKACRCKKVLRGYGTKHGHLVGDDQQKFSCEKRSNNSKTLFFYRINLNPTVNFDSPSPTTIFHNGKQFTFQGFCLLSHQSLDKYPVAQMTRFNVPYTATLENIPVPENFVIEDLNLIKNYLFSEILELKDFRLKSEIFEKDEKICDSFHFFPLFGKICEKTKNFLEISPISSFLDHIFYEFRFVFDENEKIWLKTTSNSRFEDFVQRFRGGIVSAPGKKPSSIRVDQIDKNSRDVITTDKKDKEYPAFIHFTTRSSNTSDQNFFKAQRKLENLRTAMESKSRDEVTPEEKMRLREEEKMVEEMRTRLNVKRDVTVVLTSRHFYHTGLRSDVTQYGLLIPWIAFHYRFHISLDILEQKLGHAFNDRNLLELALTHPSYRTNTGCNPDHIRNSQMNLGLRKTTYGQTNIIAKSGMKTLIETMAQLGEEDESASPIKNYERLEFLGDAVLEFLTSVRLFLMFPDLQEGSLATFRATLVQNNHLALLAEAYNLSHFLLLSHGRELSSRKRITDRHATANCFEAICGAIYLDGGIKFVDEFISKSLGTRLFGGDEHLYNIWRYPPAHISETEYPNGDRHLIEKHELLQRVTGFEQLTGIYFNHIRLLANAFSSRQVHENPITIGNNQRLEFLGDTVLQLIVSDHLFKHFPSHHEGHLSLLRSSLVSNETQALICDELNMRRFLIKDATVTKDGHVPDIKMKDKADLVEAFLGALYLDKGLIVSEAFCKVVFFPKLTDFIGNQSWSDPKSRLQQCCLTLRTSEKGQPKLPEYKMINKEGPSNNRRYEVAVYFNGERLASGTGPNTKQAEKTAANAALKNPIFFSHFQKQQNFAKRAVEAQKHQSRFSNTQNTSTDRDRSASSSQSSRREEVPPRREREQFHPGTSNGHRNEFNSRRGEGNDWRGEGNGWRGEGPIRHERKDRVSQATPYDRPSAARDTLPRSADGRFS